MHRKPEDWIGLRSNGLVFEAVSTEKPHLLFCAGGSQKIGVCLKCAHPLSNTGYCKDRRTFFAGHTCKEKQVRDYGKGPGAGRKGKVTVAAPVVEKVIHTKTIIEKLVVPPEEMEKEYRADPKLGYLFAKPEKDDDDDWSDSDEEEETFGEALRRHLLSIGKYEKSMKRQADQFAEKIRKLEAELEASEIAKRELVKQIALHDAVVANHVAAVKEATVRIIEQDEIIIQHVPEPVRVSSGLSISYAGRLPHEV